MYYTYGHYKADSKELFYVGKGKGSRAHEKDSRSDYWRNIVNKYGYTVEIFAEWEFEKDAFIHERFLIDCFQDLTDLCNLTDGGEGCSGYVWTDEQKAKLKLRTPPRLGVVLSEKTKQQIRLSQLGVVRGPHTKEHSQKIGQALKGKAKTSEQADRLRKMATQTAKVVRVCTNCGHKGCGPNMYRYHFDNCKVKHGEKQWMMM
jgi:hypothetical protein